ncbi:MAG: hypothetical protein KA713_14615 [Chryseotalea sp. WA131a]|nr:MAG: hypothetical protein KA713_14615 [Chryseotalea sp. WA131a]
MRKPIVLLWIAIFVASCQPTKKETPPKGASDYASLVNLFKEWRAFETPPMRDGAPDYTATTFEQRMPAFKKLQEKLLAMDTARWPIEHRVDWHLVWAEMNGFDFNHRVLQPWVRDPAYYATVKTERSDVPAHEGPTHHKTLELWTYQFPLSPEAKTKLIQELGIIVPLNAQAKINLTGNAKDLWIAGIRDIKTQSEDLATILQKQGANEHSDLVAAVNAAIQSTDELASWLEKEAASKTGSSGIGKENYTWYLQNVHLVPMTWEDEVLLLKRELVRAWTGLKLEEHRNRKLPLLTSAETPEAFAALTERAAKSLMNFLEKDEILTVKDYFEPALREHLGSFVPAEKRNFFVIGLHHDPRPLYSHFYHWFELARMDREPNKSEIRKGPLLYNIFDTRNEGTATAVEEMFMQAGLYNDDPRVKEIVYIMIAQRAARGLGSLYAHANQLTMEEAGKIHSEYTPRGWMKTEKKLLLFEQHLYMRQPGYGSSYITGKYLLETAMADFAKMKESKNEEFKIKDFLDQVNANDCIPISLINWQMTGNEKALTGEMK